MCGNCALRSVLLGKVQPAEEALRKAETVNVDPTRESKYNPPASARLNHSLSSTH